MSTPEPPPSSARNTKDRILDAAEALFAEHGFDGTSLRGVTGAAEVNLAAVHYHFGSKSALFEAVVHRRVDDLNAERLQLLDQAEDASDPPDVSAVLVAFLRPAFERLAHADEGFQRFLCLMGRVHGAPGPEFANLKRCFQGVQERFVPALRRAAPHLDEATLQWRFLFLLGAMSKFLIDPARVQMLCDDACSAGDHEEALRQLVAYAAAGFEAPVPTEAPAPGGDA